MIALFFIICSVVYVYIKYQEHKEIRDMKDFVPTGMTIKQAKIEADAAKELFKAHKEEGIDSVYFKDFSQKMKIWQELKRRESARIEADMEMEMRASELYSERN